MKKMRLLLTFIIVAASTTIGFAQQITGSAHDFSAETWNTSGQICIVCHTPHNGNTTVPNAPLWNHRLSVVATYSVYTSGTLNATPGQPSGLSKLCLSCHDGTVALEDFGGVFVGTNLISGGANFGTDLSNDHPISFLYTTALATADGGLWDPSTRTSGQGGTIAADWLSGGSMECSSCHDVHNAYNQSSLLRVSNAGSALCLTCHNK